jgi:hypothetical protein
MFHAAGVGEKASMGILRKLPESGPEANPAAVSANLAMSS